MALPAQHLLWYCENFFLFVYYTGRDGRKTCQTPPPDYSCLFLNPTVQYEEIVFLSLLFAVQNSDVSTSDLQQAFQALKAETDLS
jgi:hypothetical protein